MDFPKPITIEKEEDDMSNGAGQYAMQLASAAVLPMVLKASIEVGLFDAIHKAGGNANLSASDIASRIHLNESSPNGRLMLDRILGLLTSYSILTSSTATSGQQLYGLAPVGRYFVRGNVSLVPLFQMIHDNVMIGTWKHLKDAVLDGGVPFDRTYGMSASEYVALDSRFASLFRESMVDYNVLFMEKILKDYEGFNDVTSVVDVGGGNGFVLNMIVSKYTSIKGINFDAPTVIEKSPSYPGIENVAGDMFDTIPKGDAVFLKWILHNLDDQQCLKVLKNCYAALPENGKLMIVDLAVPEETTPDSISILQFDLFLSSMNHGGKERTAKEFQVLAEQAGFSSIKVAIQAFNFSLLEFCKN